VNVSNTLDNGNFTATVSIHIFHHALEEEAILLKYYSNTDLC